MWVFYVVQVSPPVLTHEVRNQLGNFLQVQLKSSHFHVENMVNVFFLQFLQPIWTEGERSDELFNSSGTKSLPFYPQRVPPQIFSDQKTSGKLTTSPETNSGSELESSLDDIPADSSSAEFEAKIEVVIDTNKNKLSTLV